MAVTLRPLSSADYPAFTELYNRCRPAVPQTEAALRAFDEMHQGDLLLNVVAEADGELVGAVWAHTDSAGERQVRLDMAVSEGLALADTLYQTAVGRLEAHRPSALLVRVREDWPYSRQHPGLNQNQFSLNCPGRTLGDDACIQPAQYL